VRPAVAILERGRIVALDTPTGLVDRGLRLVPGAFRPMARWTSIR